MAPSKRSITLKLAPWQVRMAKDFLSTRLMKIERVRISSALDRIHTMTYRLPEEGISRNSWNLYLTDLQITRIKEKFDIKTSISAINVTDALIKEGIIVFA